MWTQTHSHNRALKRAGVKVNGHKKQVFVGIVKAENEKVKARLEVLVKSGYNIQYEIE